MSVFDFVLALHSMSDVLYNYQVHYYYYYYYYYYHYAMHGLQKKGDAKLYPVLIDSFEEYRYVHRRSIFQCMAMLL